MPSARCLPALQPRSSGPCTYLWTCSDPAFYKCTRMMICRASDDNSIPALCCSSRLCLIFSYGSKIPGHREQSMVGALMTIGGVSPCLLRVSLLGRETMGSKPTERFVVIWPIESAKSVFVGCSLVLMATATNIIRFFQGAPGHTSAPNCIHCFEGIPTQPIFLKITASDMKILEVMGSEVPLISYPGNNILLLL